MINWRGTRTRGANHTATHLLHTPRCREVLGKFT